MIGTQYIAGEFRGWDWTRRVIEELGPGEVLHALVDSAWKQVKGPAGRFVGNPIHHYRNHDAACRVALRLWLDQGCPQPRQLTPESAARLIEVLVSLSGVVAIGPIRTASEAYCGPTRADEVRRVALTSWITTIQDRYRNRPALHEIGRVWLALRDSWEATSARARSEGSLPPPLRSAFDSLETALVLSYAAFITDGWIWDPRHVFAPTRMLGEIEEVIRYHVPDAGSVVGTWEQIEHEVEHSLGSRFAVEPLVRLPNGAVVAPDPGFMMPAIEERLIRRIKATYKEEVLDIAEAGPTALGYAFEDVVAGLVQDAARHSADERFVPEFGLGDGRHSPDAHLLGGGTALIFEAKAVRLDEPPDAEASLAGLVALLERATGARHTGARWRPALQQGTSFVQAWEAGTAAAVDQLGPMPDDVLYVVVIPFDLPSCVHWDAWRDQEWRPRLGPSEAQFDRRVVFLTVNDLEVAVMALVQRHDSGASTTLRALLSEWLADWRGNDPVRSVEGDVMQVRQGLADYLMSTRKFASPRLPVLDGAIQDSFDALLSRLFHASEIAAFS